MKEKGAEATVESRNGKILKTREPKKYRHRDLDRKIREERTETEVKLMKEAIKYGVNAPNPEKIGKAEIEMEEIDGRPLKEEADERPELLKDMGENVANLHSADIIHGDLTTSNALVDQELFIIDFGLSFRSQRVEDRAVDIHLLKQVLNSSHPEVAEEAWNHFLEGYRPENREEVLDQLEEVEKRGRYK
ncbi:MAG: KEOPS complex kinase/ATPase Bud32 [Candidatus Nanohalobium sp.]